MEEQVVNLKEFKKEAAKRRWKERVKKVGNWIVQNPEKAAVIGTSGVALTKWMLRIVNSSIRTAETRKETKAKKCRIYDRSLMKHWELKRPLTNKELKRIDDRKKDEKLVDILSEMRVLK